MLIQIDRQDNGILTDIYLNFIYQAFQNYHGETEGIYFFGVDVTEQVLSRRKIEANEKRFQALIEKSKDVIVVAKSDGSLIYSSLSFALFLGYSSEECASIPLFNFVGIEDLALFLKNYHAIESAPGKSINFTSRLKTKSGNLIWCEGTITNMLLEPGINAMVLNFRDISDKKFKEEEREKMVSNLLQHSKNLEQFSYIISHNLRGPVANILGLANVLKSDLTEEDRKKTQNFLFNAVFKMDDTLKDLNKILSVRSELAEHKEVLDFQTLVEDVSNSIENIISSSGAVIQADFKELKEIKTIKSFLHSIFYNLILNSIKYRQNNLAPLIKIRSENLHDKIKIIFQDNGSGIDLTLHGDKIFGLYNRFHINVEGRGLGLFMIKTQVESLGGKISVNSKPGQGSEFIVELPK